MKRLHGSGIFERGRGLLARAYRLYLARECWRWLKHNWWLLSLIGITGVMFAPEVYKLAGVALMAAGLWLDQSRSTAEGGGE